MMVRRAAVADSAAIASIHVSAWRSAYAGILPNGYLSGMSVTRHAASFQASIAAGHGTLVAEAGGRLVGYATFGRARSKGIGDGEVETLYVLDDWRDQGFGRRLLQASALQLSQNGCRSLFLWVLQQNPSQWFYQRLGGRAAMRSVTSVAGQRLDQTAYVWDPIGQLLGASAKG